MIDKGWKIVMCFQNSLQVWSMAGNKISWLNTYKMKMSIIFGVSQMMYGNIMALMNHMYVYKLTVIE